MTFQGDADYYEIHDELDVGSLIFFRCAAELRTGAPDVVCRHAHLAPDSATLQAIIWDTHTVWRKECGQLISFPVPEIPDPPVPSEEDIVFA